MAAARAVVERMIETDGDEPGAMPLSREEARCVAGGVLDVLDLPRMNELGLDIEAGVGPELSEPPLTPDEADELYATYEDCVDLEGHLAGLFGEDPTLSEEQARCMATEYVGSGLLREALFSPAFDPQLNERIDFAISEALGICVVED